ncbi:MAG: HAD family phosphatase, partial [Rhodothermaceae bacterium]|nr:HAD family phosphatase [Rhodothermaceae bacterium]
TVAELAGVDDLIIAENLFSALALNSYVKIVEEKVALYESRLDRNSPYPGAAELIDSLLSEEKNISICSGSPRKYIVPFVREYYNLDSFTKIIGSEDYIEHKPSPEPYLIALEDSNFDPSCTIVIEDSIDGCTAATEANLTVIHLDAYYINSKIPDYRVRSLNEITAAIGTEVEGIIS